jgi:hypothetical protein
MKPVKIYLLKYIISFALVCAILIGCNPINPPQAVVRDFFQAVAIGDYETAKQFCTDEFLQERILGETLENWCASVDPEQTITTRIHVVNVETDWANVAFELNILGKGTSLRTSSLLADLVLVKGKWKIRAINAR